MVMVVARKLHAASLPQRAFPGISACILSLQTPCIAEDHSAICSGGTEFSVLLGVGKINMPGLTINKDNVLF